MGAGVGKTGGPASSGSQGTGVAPAGPPWLVAAQPARANVARSRVALRTSILPEITAGEPQGYIVRFRRGRDSAIFTGFIRARDLTVDVLQRLLYPCPQRLALSSSDFADD